jgi:hypothetical protein
MGRFAPKPLLGLLLVALMVPAGPSRGSTSDELPNLPLCDSDPPAPEAEEFPPPVAGDVSLELVGQVGGEVGPLALSQNHLYVGVGQRIAVLDLSRPRAPRTVGFSESLPERVEDVVASGVLLAAAAGDAGLFLFDISVADEPQQIASLQSPGYAHAVSIAGGLALLADGPGGLRIVDVSDPARPSELGAAFDLHNVLGVATQGTHAFLAAADEGLLVVDLADPTTPLEAGSLHSGGFANRITVEKGIAYLADAWGGLRTIDVTTPSSPARLGRARTSAWAMDVAVKGTRAYVAAGSDGLRVLDVSDAARPKKLGAIRVPRGHAAHVAVRDGLAYLSDIYAGLHVIDVSAPRSPAKVRLLDPLGPAKAVALHGDHAFVAADTLGLKVVDVSDPAQPREVGGVRTPGSATGVVVSGSNVFLTGSLPGSPITGIDASDPTRPRMKSSYLMNFHEEDTGFETGPAGIRGLAEQDGILYVANEWGMGVMDGRTPSPCELGFLLTANSDFSGAITIGVSPAGSTTYLGLDPPGFYVADVSDLGRPRLVSRFDQDVHWPLAVGSALYGAVLGGSQGPIPALHTFDLSEPTAPRHVATVTLPSGPDGLATSPLAYAGGKLFVAGGAGGLFVVDVSELDSPRLAGRIRLGGPALGVAADDRHAYVATGSGGLSIVEWAPAASSTEMTASGVGLATTGDRTVAAVTTARSSTGSVSRCTVTSRADNGRNTLRGCLGRVGKGGVVKFDRSVFPAGDPARVRLRSELPRLRHVTVNGRGAGVILDGEGSVGDGLTLRSRVTVRGLRIQNFRHNGIWIGGSGNMVGGSVVTGNENGILINPFGRRARKNRIIGNHIGIDPDGSLPSARQVTGVWIMGGTNNVVGGDRARQRNVISGNSRYDINIFDASRNSIIGNYIGTDPSGTELRHHPDNVFAVNVEVGANRNRIAHNVIGGSVLILDPGSSYNSVVGNKIGVGVTGEPLGCQPPIQCGVGLVMRFNRVGGSRASEGNIIDGDVHIATTSDTVVLGNRLKAMYGRSAIHLGGAERNTIGGRSPQGRNTVEGGPDPPTWSVLIWKESRFNTVIGNAIGGGSPDAVAIAGSGHNFLVANEITGFTQTGIVLQDGAFANSVRGNVVDGGGAGIRAFVSEGNLIAGNAFLHVPVNAGDEGEGNLWDDGARGNFWADYTGTDGEGDGIGDTERAVPPNGVDRFPLIVSPI